MRTETSEVAEAGDLLLSSQWLNDISERSNQLDPVLVVSRHSVPFFILLNSPYAWVREQLEGGSNLFGGWDIVRVFHAYNDPPDVFRCLHGSVGTLESSDDRKKSLSSIDPILDTLIEEIEPASSRELSSWLADREVNVEINVHCASDFLTTAEKRDLVLGRVIPGDAERPLLTRELLPRA